MHGHVRALADLGATTDRTRVKHYRPVIGRHPELKSPRMDDRLAVQVENGKWDGFRRHHTAPLG